MAESDEYEKNFQKSNESGGKDGTGNDFEIGIWDPNAVELLEDDWKNEFGANIQICGGVESATVDGSGDKKNTVNTFDAVDGDSGDEWETEEDIYFDMEFRLYYLPYSSLL